MFFFFFFLNTVNAATLNRGQEFWTTAEVQAIQWKDDCLTTATCVNPRLQMTMNMISTHEKQTTEWAVYDEGHGKVLSAYWHQGLPSDVTIYSQIMGYDPKYHFPRECDIAPSKKVFFSAERQDYHSFVLPTAESPEPSESTVTLHAKCYNVTLLVKTHTTKCPWCPDPELPKQEKQSALKSLLNEENYQLVIFILLGITVFSVISAVILALVNCRSNIVYSRTNSTVASSFYSPERKQLIATMSSRIPSPPRFVSPSPPSTTTSTNSVVIRDDLLRDDTYDRISEHATIYREHSIGEMV